MGTDERTAPNKNKMGMQTRANLTSCAFFSTNVPTGFKTRIRKSSREVESNLEKDGRKKMKAQWARLQSCKKTKLV